VAEIVAAPSDNRPNSNLTAVSTKIQQKLRTSWADT